MNFEAFSFLWERLANFLIDEIRDGIRILWTDEKELIESLKREVEVAQCHLKRVDEIQRKADLDPVLQISVGRVMEIRDEIEDFLDWLIDEQEQGTSLFSRLSGGSLKRKRSAVLGLKKLQDKLHLAIQTLVDLLGPRGDPPQVNPRRQRFRTQPDNFREEFIVGLREDVEAYVAKLLPREGANRGSCTDLAIFGMGGSGKTTAARLVYNHQEITEHFDRRAWVCVSQTWDTNDLLHQICHQFGLPCSCNDDHERMLSGLKEFIQNHSCFFVLDDVWEVESLQELLPPLRSRQVGNNGGRAPSRVLVTTRNKEIFNFPQNDFSLEKIRPLTFDESKDLLIRTIRRNRPEDWNLEGEFEELGKEMLYKCRGLPLAIVALGGILSLRDTVPHWECIKSDVVRRISSHKGSDDDYVAVTEILELSYFDLPSYLKPCFIYLGIFPEDSIIGVDKLIKLWIAEGFIKVDQHSCSSTVEALARDYLDELAHRYMVEVGEKNYGGEISTIQIHDLMRDLCSRKAEDLKFFELVPSSTSTSTHVDKNSCRIILHGENPILNHSWPSSDINFSLSSFIKTKKRVRSFIMGLEFNPITDAIIILSLEGMKYLRVLHLFEVELKDTRRGTQIGDLILLRHLHLISCKVSRGHALSIKKLRNLLSFTCDKCTWEVGVPPNLVGGMHHLRHLYLEYSEVGELGVPNKSNLQTLSAWGGDWVTTELPHASPCLQELSLSYIESSPQLEAVYNFFSKPGEHLLRSLDLRFSNLEFDLQKLQVLGRCASLKLTGKIRSHPDHPFGQFPRRLLSLHLSCSQIGEEEQLKAALAQLDELRYLKLSCDAYNGDRLSISGLPKLQYLWLCQLTNLKEWRIESGALCRLQELKISCCSNLESLPQQISCISTLKCFETYGMPQTFSSRLKLPSENGEGGEDFHLISCIPTLKLGD